MDTQRYAIVVDGVVTNVTMWDGISEWNPPEGAVLIPDPDCQASPNDSYDNGKFIRSVVIETPTIDNIQVITEFVKTLTPDQRTALGQLLRVKD